MTRAGRLEAIWIKRERRGRMEPVDEAEVAEGWGLVGNVNQGIRRQVTVIEREVWDALAEELGPEVDPAFRRANLMVSGVRLRERAGRRLAVGSCLIELVGETKPCARMDEAFPGLREALEPDWRGGAYGRVLREGTIRVGDPVSLHPAERDRRRS